MIYLLSLICLRLSKRLINWNLKPKDINDILKEKPPSKPDKGKKGGLHHLTKAKLIIDTLKSFTNSTEEFITTLHVPNSYKKTISLDQRADGGDQPSRSEQCVFVDLEHNEKMVYLFTDLSQTYQISLFYFTMLTFCEILNHEN